MNRISGMQKYAGWGILSGVFFGSMGGTSCLPESCAGVDTTGSFSPAHGRMIFARAKKEMPIIGISMLRAIEDSNSRPSGP